MKPLRPPYVPGITGAERFDNAVRKLFTVSKGSLLKGRGAAEESPGSQEGGEETMSPTTHIRGPYQPGTASDEGFQLACRGCTVGDLIALANRRNVTPQHVLGDVTKGARRTRKMGKDDTTHPSTTWLWEISINGGPPEVDVRLSCEPLTRVQILNPRRL